MIDPTNNNKRWSSEEEESIFFQINFKAKYRSFEIIAKHLGRTSVAVKQRYYKYLKPFKLPLDKPVDIKAIPVVPPKIISRKKVKIEQFMELLTSEEKIKVAKQLILENYE